MMKAIHMSNPLDLAVKLNSWQFQKLLLDSFGFPVCGTDLERNSNLQLRGYCSKKSENLGSTQASYSKANSAGISSRRSLFYELPQVDKVPFRSGIRIFISTNSAPKNLQIRKLYKQDTLNRLLNESPQTISFL